MKIQKITRKMAMLAGTVCFATLVFVCPSVSLSAQAAVTPVQESIQPRKDDIQYVFTIRDGKMYKRLYNYSNGDWIGDWIYVCDYPG